VDIGSKFGSQKNIYLKFYSLSFDDFFRHGAVYAEGRRGEHTRVLENARLDWSNTFAINDPDEVIEKIPHFFRRHPLLLNFYPKITLAIVI